MKPEGAERDRVAVRHPHRLLRGEVAQQQPLRSRHHGHFRAAELGQPGALDHAAQSLRHRLEAVADAENRDAGVEQRRVDRRRTLGVDGRRAARQDHRGRLSGDDLRDRHRVRDDLAVDVGLAHPARDQLRVLRAEVDHQHRGACGLAHGKPPLASGIVR